MNVGVLASHEGTTLQSLLDAFAGQAGIQAVHFSSKTHEDPAVLDAAIRGVLIAAGVDVLFLAGYMKKLGPLVLVRGDSLDDLKARVQAREKEFVVETLGQIARGEIRLVRRR